MTGHCSFLLSIDKNWIWNVIIKKKTNLKLKNQIYNKLATFQTLKSCCSATLYVNIAYFWLLPNFHWPYIILCFQFNFLHYANKMYSLLVFSKILQAFITSSSLFLHRSQHILTRMKITNGLWNRTIRNQLAKCNCWNMEI